MSKRKKRVVLPNVVQSAKTESQDRSPHVHQRDKLAFELNPREREDLTEKQRKFIELMTDKDTRLVFVEGPAGTSKTFMAVYCGLLLMKRRSVSDLLYVRSIAESASKSLGSLPGDQNLKMHPFLMPLYDKLDELLPRIEVDRLIKEERIQGIPINFLRGSSFNARFIVADESQNFDIKELTTLITRLGKFSKMVIAGDITQSDINGKSGFGKMISIFDDEESRQKGIHCFKFTKEDIVRSGILRFIVERLEKQSHQESMFPPRSERTL